MVKIGIIGGSGLDDPELLINYEEKEIDIILRNGKTIQLEVKWDTRKYKFPKSFLGRKIIINYTDGYRFII